MYTLLVPSLTFALASAPFPLGFVEPPPQPNASPTADDKSRAKELFENGRELYLGGSYDAAVAAFKQAYALSGDPILLYNIAEAYDRGSRYDDAIEYIEYYQAYASASEREELTQRIESLRRRKLKDDAASKGAETADGDAGDVSEDTSEGTDDGTVALGSDSMKDQKVFTPLAIALTAVAGVGLGTGIGLGIVSSRRSDDAEAFCGGFPTVCSAQADSDLKATRNMAIGANVSFAVAGAAAIGAIVVIAINARKKKNAGGTTSRVELQPTTSGIRLRF